MTPLFVCLDVQRAFVEPGDLYAPHAGQALLHGRRLLRLARERHWRIAHCLLRRSQEPLRLTPQGARPVEGFEPSTSEHVFERGELSAYRHPAFEQMVAKSQRAGVLFIGLSASLTFVATLLDGFERGHRGIVAADAMAAQEGRHADAQAHAAVSKDIADLLGFTLRTSSDADLAGRALVHVADRSRGQK
ncbi:MAG: isochorismatase family protein [Hyphomonadaceae bacterium]